MKYLYGPVPSRRLGASLGIDLVPHKTCSYNCIYCQCGQTTHKTLQRKEYVPIKQVIEEAKTFLAHYKGRLDYLTLSGAGEPTLNSGIGEVIRRLKQLSDKPVAVLTNSSLLWRPDVQSELMAADVIVPSLDAATPKAFLSVNRPKPIKLQAIINGLVEFRNCFKGKIWLEIFLVRLYNDDKEHLEALKKAIKLIRPDKIQLNTVTRPPSEDFAYPVLPEEMQKIAKFFGEGTEIIAEQEMEIPQESVDTDPKGRIWSLLARRPCRIPEIINSLGLDETKGAQYIADLENEKKIRYTVINKQIYYHLRRE